MKLSNQDLASVQEMFSGTSERVADLHKAYRAHLDGEAAEDDKVNWNLVAERLGGVVE